MKAGSRNRTPLERERLDGHATSQLENDTHGAMDWPHRAVTALCAHIRVAPSYILKARSALIARRETRSVTARALPQAAWSLLAWCPHSGGDLVAGYCR